MARRPTSATTLGPFEYRFAPSTSFIRLARHALAAWLQAQPRVNVDGIDDLLIACSELCTNAVDYASGAEGSVALRAFAKDDAVVIEVEDDGPGGLDWPAKHSIHDLGIHDDHGRGLFIVESLTDSLDIERVGGRTVVRCCKDGIISHEGGPSDAALSQRFQSFGG